MRLVIQRVLQAEVQVNENTVGKINKDCLDCVFLKMKRERLICP